MISTEVYPKTLPFFPFCSSLMKTPKALEIIIVGYLNLCTAVGCVTLWQRLFRTGSPNEYKS